MNIRVLVVIVAALSLGACASSYVGKPYERPAAALHSVALADDSVPEKAIAYEVASVGSNFGLIGALVDAGIQSSRQDAVNDALTTAGFDAEAKLEDRVISQLAMEGYAVQVHGNAPRTKRAFLTAYPKGDGAEAYLDIVIQTYGYLSAGAGQPFRPTVYADVRLVSAVDPSKTLMENRIAYNAMSPPRGVITLTPNPEYEFKNRNDMVENPERLAAGIEDALYQVADATAKLLK